MEEGSLNWVPVRGYSKEEGGLPGPGDSPGEVCFYFSFDFDWVLGFSAWTLVD